MSVFATPPKLARGQQAKFAVAVEEVRLRGEDRFVLRGILIEIDARHEIATGAVRRPAKPYSLARVSAATDTPKKIINSWVNARRSRRAPRAVVADFARKKS